MIHDDRIFIRLDKTPKCDGQTVWDRRTDRSTPWLLQRSALRACHKILLTPLD